jgi:hypothetical protein
MRRLKLITAGALAAVTIAVGGLAAPPPAAAMPKSTCLALAQLYITHSKVFGALGEYTLAAYWAGRADGMMDSCS